MHLLLQITLAPSILFIMLCTLCFWFVFCFQDYGKTTGLVSMKLGGSHGLRTNPSQFGALLVSFCFVFLSLTGRITFLSEDKR